MIVSSFLLTLATTLLALSGMYSFCILQRLLLYVSYWVHRSTNGSGKSLGTQTFSLWQRLHGHVDAFCCADVGRLGGVSIFSETLMLMEFPVLLKITMNITLGRPCNVWLKSALNRASFNHKIILMLFAVQSSESWMA